MGMERQRCRRQARHACANSLRRDPREPDPSPTDRMGDNEAIGASSTTHPGDHREPRKLRGRRSNTTGRTGTVTDAQQRHVGRSRSWPMLDAETRTTARPLTSEFAHQFVQLAAQLVEREFDGRRTRSDEEKTGRHGGLGQDRPHSTAQQIARDGIADGATDGERHAWRRHGEIFDVCTPNGSDPHSATFAAKPLEGLARADPIDQADRRARPLSRRDFNTARPARVLMRARKPCFFERRRWFGW